MTMSYDPQHARYAMGAGARPIDRALIDQGLRQHMLRVYNYMAGGLAVSGLVAFLIYSTPALFSVFFTPYGLSGLGWIAVFAPLGLLLWMSFGARAMSAGTMQTLYWAFVALQGVSLSTLLLIYTGESIVRVFFITAAAFAGLSLWGYTTQRSLSGIGSFMIMGLFGLVIASLVNIFLGSSSLQFAISVIGVLVFAGLTAYDTQRIKEEYVEGMGYDIATKTAVWGAVALYLNFLNMFQFLLSLLGNRE